MNIPEFAERGNMTDADYEWLANSGKVSDMGDTFRHLSDVLTELARYLCDVIVPAFQKITETFWERLDVIFQHMNPRCYHIYKHAKKACVRNKNKNRLLKELRLLLYEEEQKGE